MNNLNCYIAREVLKGSSMAMLIVLTLVTFFTLTDELRHLGEGDYGLKEILHYELLTTPRNFYEMTASACLLGSLFTLGAMGNHHEIVAMRAAGVSLFRIMWAVLRPGLLLAAIAVTIGEFIAPDCERAAQMLSANARKQQVTLVSQYGFWARDGDTFINIRRVHESDRVSDVNIFQLDGEHRLHTATHAQTGYYAGGLWHLENIQETAFRPDGVTVETLERKNWKSRLDPDLLSIVVVYPENLSLLELWKYLSFLRENGQDYASFELSFWRRLIKPATILVMLLVAIPFVLGVRRSINVGQRIVLGAVIGLGFVLFERVFGNIGIVYELNPLFAAGLPTLVVLVGALTGIRMLR